ncbi:MAG: TRAP transporter fused permease subunit [Chloroflexi bacterium]|nr:TRAP transporter fused permease subunit [Chloroflexota bacterium]
MSLLQQGVRGVGTAAVEEYRTVTGAIVKEIWPLTPQGLLRLFLAVIAAGTAALYMYTAYAGVFMPIIQRSILLASTLVLLFLTPLSFGKLSRSRIVVNSLLAIGAAASIFIVVQFYSTIGAKALLRPGLFTLIAGGVLMLIVAEATRRMLGWSLVVCTAIAFLYAYFGKHMPGPLYNPGFSLYSLVSYSSISISGIFGPVLDVAAGVILMFMAMSIFLQASGLDIFFTQLPTALMGWVRGGPAKTAVVGSTLFGTISGSAVANVAAVGMFTIPLMKKTGYSGRFAGAIETAASSGGQIMPPVMGAAAFIMADILGIPYVTIAAAALFPGLLYYFSLFLVVDAEAVKHGFKGVPRSELPSVKKVLADGWYLVIPLVVMIFMIVEEYSLMRSALFAIVLTIIMSWFRRGHRMGPVAIFKALRQTSMTMIMVVVACAITGMLVGFIERTGIGLSLSLLLVQLSQGNLFLLLVLSMLVSLIAGLGLPTTASYLFLAYLIGPALIQMGVPPISAHLFLLYYAALSAITPPNAPSAFAAAPVAGEDPTRIGITASIISISAYLMPFIFVYNPALILQGSAFDIILTLLFIIPAVWAIVGVVTGQFLGERNIPERLLLAVAALSLIYTFVPFRIAGLLLVSFLALRRRRSVKVSEASGAS